MAEGRTQQLGGLSITAQSAGIEAHGQNTRAIAVMKEAGVDISGQESTQVTDALLEQADLVVTVCGHADEHCPILPPGTRKAHWPGEGPEKAAGTEAEVIDIFRSTRDDIRHRVEELLQEQVLQG